MRQDLPLRALMNDEIKTFVRERAANRCEYCRIEQRWFPGFTFHVEHIIARQHGGSDHLENLGMNSEVRSQVRRDILRFEEA